MASAPQLSPAEATRELSAWVASQRVCRTAQLESAAAPRPRAGRDPQWVILIDDHSGSGKNHFAAHLMATLGASSQQTGASPSTSPTPGAAPRLVHLEDFYPGWVGLFAAARMLAAEVLLRHCPCSRRWDWG